MIPEIRMKVIFYIAFTVSLLGCSDKDAKREAAADVAYDAAYDHCIFKLKQSADECDVYMEQNWKTFYREPN